MSNILEEWEIDEDTCVCTCLCNNLFDHVDGYPCKGCKTLFCSDCVEVPWEYCPGCREENGE